MSRKARERIAHTEKRVEKRDRMLEHNFSAERATLEEVFDQATRMVVYRFMTEGVLDEVNGVVGPGKERGGFWGKDKERKGFGCEDLLDEFCRVQEGHVQVH